MPALAEPMAIKRTGFGGKLQSLRKRLGINQEQAGKAVGASKRAWQWWEAGGRKPHKSYLMLIEMLENGTIQPPKPRKKKS